MGLGSSEPSAYTVDLIIIPAFKILSVREQLLTPNPTNLNCHSIVLCADCMAGEHLVSDINNE